MIRDEPARLDQMGNAFVFVLLVNFVASSSPRHQVDAETSQHRHHDPKKRGGDQAVQAQRRPKAPAMTPHPRKNQKHRQGRQYKPKGTFGMVRQALARLTALMHPDHRQQRSERQRNQKRRKPVVEELDLVHRDDDQGTQEPFRQIQTRKRQQFVPKLSSEHGWNHEKFG